MPNTNRITARIVGLLGDHGWSLSRSEDDAEYSVLTRNSAAEVLLVLPRDAVSLYLGGLVAGYLPHEVIDNIGTSPIEDELAATVAELLDAALSESAPGVLTEVGIRSDGTGAEIYSTRAMRAALPD